MEKLTKCFKPGAPGEISVIAQPHVVSDLNYEKEHVITVQDAMEFHLNVLNAF